MFKIGDLVTPKEQYINDGIIFLIVDVNLGKRQYTLKCLEEISRPYIADTWKSEELYMIRTIESLKKSSYESSKNLLEIINDTIDKFNKEIKFAYRVPYKWKIREHINETTNTNIENEELFKQQILGIWDLEKDNPFTIAIDTIQPNKNEREEKDMLKILEIYKDKKEKEIYQKYDAQLEELEGNDPVKVYLKQAEETIKEMLNKENITLCVNSPCVEFTQETIDARNKIIETIRNEKSKLNNKIKEIESLLELAPGYEEKIKILRDYEIIDKKKNVIL